MHEAGEEAAVLRWEHVDLEKQEIFIPVPNRSRLAPHIHHHGAPIENFRRR